MHIFSLLASGTTVLTASRRLAHALRLSYAAQAQQQGLKAWRTPNVVPWSAWLREQWLEQRAQSAESGRRLLSRAQSRVVWEDIVNESAWAQELLAPASAARLAARSWQRMHEFLLDIEALAGAEGAEAQALYAWSQDFVRRCAELHAIDEARLEQWAFESAWLPQERIALVGFDGLTPAVARLVERWRAAGKVADVVAPTVDTHVTAQSAYDRDAEIAAAAAWARAQLSSGATQIGLVIADLATRKHAVRRVIEDAFAPASRHTGAQSAGIPVVFAAPEPLASYAVVDAAFLCLELVLGEQDSTTAGRLLRSAFIGGADTERDQRALADLRLREEQRDRWDWFEMERWAAVTGCTQLQLLARQMTVIVRANPTRASASTWAERCHAMLSALGWPGERSLSSVEHQTVAKFQAVLGEFGTLEAVLGVLSPRKALRHLRDLAQQTPFEPQSTAAQITVIDSTTVAGMQFDALWVAGLDASHLPTPVNPDPLIPLELQRAAGIPQASATASYSLAKTQFDRLLRSASAVVLSWSRRDGDAQLQPSPLLRPWLHEAAGEEGVVATQSLRRLQFDLRPTLESLHDERAPRLAAQNARGGAMTVELQSRCPFRAQAHLRLHSDPVPQVMLGIEPRVRGMLLHRVLAAVWGEFRDRQSLAALDSMQLENILRPIVERCAAQTLNAGSRGRARLAALEVATVLRQVAILLEIEKTRPDFNVQFAERSESYVIGDLKIKLQPDRVDQLGEGGFLLIDYKAGASDIPRKWLDTWPGRPKRPQLPLYALAHEQDLRALAFVILAPGAVEYRGWSDGLHIVPGVEAYPGRTRLRAGDPLDWNALLRHWRLTLTHLAQAYVAGEAAVDPLPQECQTCHLSTFCRVHERAAIEEPNALDSESMHE